MRRKGERRVIHPPLIWSEDCTVARMIRTGDKWLFAWAFQQMPKDLVKQTGVPQDRLNALHHGAEPTEAELAKLAIPLRTDPGSLRASIAYEQAVWTLHKERCASK